MNYIYYSNALYHHGIKGQKKGERRYQNEDGTYTEEGKLRRRKLYNEVLKPGKDGSPSSAEKTMRRGLDILNNIKTINDKKIEKKRRNDREEEISQMSDQELRNRINRYNLEQQYNQLLKQRQQEAKVGRNAISSFLDIAIPIATIATSAVSIISTIYSIKKEMEG